MLISPPSVGDRNQLLRKGTAHVSNSITMDLHSSAASAGVLLAKK